MGVGAPVLMIHGWGARIELLQPLASRLSGHGFRCYMLDLPGFGASEEPPRAYSVRDYVDFCVAYMDAHELRSAHYFGHSLGGRIGLMLAAEHAQRVQKMTLSNSAGIKVEASQAQRMRLGVYRRARAGLRAIGMKAASETLRKLYSQRYGSADYKDASPVMRETLVKIVNQDLLAFARRVHAPTILIWGDQDEETPLWMGQQLEREMADAALITHEGAGHYAYLDFPQRTATVMRALYASA